MIRKAIGAILHLWARSAFGFAQFGARSIIKPFPKKIEGGRYVSIGADCFFGDGLVLFVAPSGDGVAQCTFGDGCVFGSDAFISCTKSITVGKAVLTSARVYIGDSYHGYSNIDRPVLHQPMEGAQPIVIGDGSFIGIGAAILPGVTLGRNCFVGANSVVTKSFPDYSVLGGVPARLLKRYDVSLCAWIEG